MTVIIGKTYRFDYPEHFVTLPEYSAHRGQLVTVTGEIEADEERMYSFVAEDGWIGEAWDSELGDL
jgi:hypothetical protein